jgi:hypothetical protein
MPLLLGRQKRTLKLENIARCFRGMGRHPVAVRLVSVVFGVLNQPVTNAAFISVVSDPIDSKKAVRLAAYSSRALTAQVAQPAWLM